MTKSERLLFIVNLFRVRKRVTLDELVRECEVSKRTVYRDLLSLSGLNIPIYFDDGYRLAREISLPALNFTEDEQELIGFSLRNSCLTRSVHLKAKIKNIEMKILSALPENVKSKRKDKLNCLMLSLTSERQCFSELEDSVIEDFLRALFGRNPIEVFLHKKYRKISGLQPKCLEIKGSRWIFCFTDGRGSEAIKIPLDRIKSISVLRVSHD